ncbi:PREDICTED: uncharacterized protein LOC105563544 [Vollenhovia emeryi]|uniref:uncharacterized protein LOC105563544 n=1 Tax=Vollenhovia emeryi TaxID=411798 RepID=UPI0005F430F4|nr:PREDICTED: uncharacterized protein LOC105563544 [Vollenhovia emeryi]
MDVVIELQGFRDIDKKKFIAKEIALVAIQEPIIGHWILTPPYPFEDLPERSRLENNWLSRNYHGIEWFDGETNLECFTLHLRRITRLARNIYTRGREKAHYLRQLLSRNIYNLEIISPPFKNLPEDGEVKISTATQGKKKKKKKKSRATTRRTPITYRASKEIAKDRNAAQTTFSLSADDGNGSTTRPPATEHWAICVSDMRESILPTDCRGCGRGRPLSSLTQTTTIDLAGTGSPSTSTNTAPERISTATDSPPWTPDSSYVYVETPPPTDGTPPPCKEYSLKPADTTAAYFYILCLTVIILGSFLIYLPMIVNAMTD